MIRWSVIIGLVGVLGTWALTIRLSRTAPSRPPELYWVLGLAALFPAWLIASLGLLGRTAGRFPEMSVAAWWILSSAAAVLGVLLTDEMVRRRRAASERHPPARYWLLGVETFAPAWGIALLGLSWSAHGHGP